MTTLFYKEGERTDRFYWQKFVLKPFLGKIPDSEKIQIVQQFDQASSDEADFLKYLNHHGLQQLWRQFLQGSDCSESLRDNLKQLKDEAFNSAANVLKQEDELRSIFRLFEENNIPSFIFKGGQLRRTLYQDPTLRPVSDIDLFVPQNRKIDAVKLLSQSGFQLNANPATVSHEASLIRNSLCIDLHWHLLRPGRTRFDVAPFLFENREQFAEGLWGLNPAASLLVMLIHPAFTKHLASPDSMLIHMVDLYRLLDQARDHWPEINQVLECTGSKTAAWSSLHLLEIYSHQIAIADLAEELEPGFLHKQYLKWWIENDLVNRWFENSEVVKIAFDLALQDSVTDAVNAIQMLFKARRSAIHNVKQLRDSVMMSDQLPGYVSE